MRKFLLSCAALALGGLAAAPALADDPTVPPSDFTVTGSAAVVSQYRFRGISQSDNKPAVQASFTVAHSSGFYISTWGSSATANDIVDIGGTEIDVYGGWTHALGHSGVTVDVGGYGYIYPGATLGNYYEIYGSLAKTYGPVTAKLGINFAPNQKNTTRSNTYVYGELSGGIPNTPISLHAHVGHTGGAFDYVGKDYVDYSAGVSYKWKALTFDISAVGTTISRKDINNFIGGDEADFPSAHDYRRISRATALASVTASF